MGSIDLPSSAWKAVALPLSYTRIESGHRGSNPGLKHGKLVRYRYAMAASLAESEGLEPSTGLHPLHAFRACS